MKLSYLIVALLVSFSAISLTLRDPGTDKTEVIEIIRLLYTSFEQEDMDLMSSVMSHDEDMVSFGTGLTEHHVGWKQWKEAHLGQFEVFDDIRVTSKDLTVFIGSSRDVAWFADVNDWHLVVDKDSIDVPDIRITGVLEKKAGDWKIVQIHASVPQS